MLQASDWAGSGFYPRKLFSNNRDPLNEYRLPTGDRRPQSLTAMAIFFRAVLAGHFGGRHGVLPHRERRPDDTGALFRRSRMSQRSRRPAASWIPLATAPRPWHPA